MPISEAYPTTTKWKNQNTAGIVADQIIFHSLANGWNFWSGVNYLLRSTNPLESHWVVAEAGARVQLVPENIVAEANYKANRRLYRGEWRGAISVETDSDVRGADPWTDKQMDSLAQLGAEIIARNPKIPARRCPAWNEPGIGYHIMFGTPGAWTPVAKACPGPRRIQQFDELLADIKRRVAAGVAARPEPIRTTLEDEMANTLLCTDPRYGVTFVIADDLTHKSPILQSEVEGYIKAKVQNGGKATWWAASAATLDAIPNIGVGVIDIVGDGKGQR